MSPLDIETQVPLAPLSRLRVGGLAAFFCRPASSDELVRALDWADERDLPVTLLGAGSNVLIDDGGIPGLTIHTRKLIRIERITEEIVRVECGCLLPRLARFAQEASRAGWEFMSAIPGTVGASCRINAGLGSGEQMADWMIEVRCRSRGRVGGRDGGRGARTLPADELRPGYRHTCLLDDPESVVTDCLLRLGPPADRAEIARTISELAEHRRRKFPARTETCGSVFRQAPGGTPAGKLLDQVGLKGFRVGGAQVAEEHANWIVNLGNATALDIRTLIATMQERVRERFGIELRREVVYLPQDRIAGDPLSQATP